MKKVIKYRNSSQEDSSSTKFNTEPSALNKIVFLVLMSASGFWFAGFIVLQFQTTESSTLLLSNRFENLEENVITTTPRTKRKITSYADWYFTKEETEFLNCSAFFNDDKDRIDAYINSGRMRLNHDKLLELDMDCDTVRTRIIGHLSAIIQPLKRPIAFIRNIYNLYELQEVFLSMSYHPDNTFCYVMDSKSDASFKKSMRIMARCFENTFVLQKEYDFDSAGHGQDKAHYDCLQHVMNRKWDHAILLQNSDLVIKSSEQLSNLSELIRTISIVGLEIGYTDRYDTTADWTPSGLKLFKNESGIPTEILYQKLNIKKSLSEVILSKTFVKSIIDKLNMEPILDLFDNKKYYGVDEMLFNTLYANYLGLEGQMESNCKKHFIDELTRLTDWNMSSKEGYMKSCTSKYKRHGVCIIGVEYLKALKKSRYVVANKVISKFDFGTVICAREMLINEAAGPIPDTSFLLSFPQFREMLMKENGTYDRTTFDC